LNARLSPSPDLGIDGEFGPVTREAVVRFQREQKLPASGEVDAATWRALGPVVTEAAPVAPPEVVNAEQLAREKENDWRVPPLVTCKAWIIADSKTGVLLWGDHERQTLDIASTTKIMTAYLVLKAAAEDSKVLDEVVTFSQRADETNGSTADLRAGEQTSVRELLYGLLLPSGNDAATALAEHFGSRFAPPGANLDPLESFVNEMNRAAESLGMKDTRYLNPHGLTVAGHRSTAADLVILARAARQLPRFPDYVSTRQHGSTVSSTAGYTRNVVWKNTNKLLTLDGYNGIKTGTTEAAGACLVSSGRRGDDELIIVVLGSASSDARYIDTRNLFRWAWRQR
jgi:D-alanyl-D-alanine carboxypeptidase (penicillin-binding protein 5/6)